MKIWSVSLCLALFLTGCTSQQPQTSATPDTTAAPESVAATSSEMFSDRDWDDSHAPASPAITFDGTAITTTSDAVTVDGSTATITQEGTYLLSGTLTGGTVVAAGPNQMAQTFGASSTQGSALLSVGSQQANTTVTLSDEAGNSLLSWDIPAAYTCVVVSCPQMTVGSSYTLTAGEFSTSFTLEDITYSSASGGAMGQPGGNTGGMGGQRPGGSMGGGPGSTPPDSASGGTMP